MKDKEIEKLIFLIAILWYTFTAFFSSGYYHADEHYQIIEFARLKSGMNQPTDLSWEFHEKIRSAAQPALCFVLFKIFSFFSVTDPYSQAFLLRLITGLASLFAISYFSRSCKHLINKKNWIFFYALSFFIWFLPWINVRFSSETYSGLSFLIAAAIVLREKKNFHHYLIIGSLLGLSFLFRFQMIAISFGLIMWLLAIKKEHTQNIFYLLLGFTCMLLAGTAIDFWFYNEYVFTPWNYFYANIIKDIASDFGTSPWYYYFYYIFRYSFFPIGIIIILAFLYLVYKKPLHFLVWMLTPFLILHSIIPHKELRFIFPLINFVPLLIILAFQELNLSANIHPEKIQKIIRITIIIIVSINLTGLIVASLKPAGMGNMKITKEIQNNSNCKTAVLINSNGSNPYDPWNGLIAKFYAGENLTPIDLKIAANDSIKLNSSCIFLVLKKKDLKNVSTEEFILKNDMQKISESIPNWMGSFLNIYGGFDSSNILVLFKKDHSKKEEKEELLKSVDQ